MLDISDLPGVQLDELAAGVVFVIRLPLDAADETWRAFTEELAPDERARAGRYPYAGDAARFAQCRLTVRSALGAVLGCRPGEVEIEYTQCGKPYLAERQARALGTSEPLSFNLSHSGDLCLIALGAFEFMGVDVEERVDSDDLQNLADRFFAPKEAARIRELSARDRREAFYACWTRKEALIKALGHGLGQYGIDKYEVLHAGDACDCLLDLPGGRQEAERWTLRDLPLPADDDAGEATHAAALAVRGAPADVVLVDWPAGALRSRQPGK